MFSRKSYSSPVSIFFSYKDIFRWYLLSSDRGRVVTPSLLARAGQSLPRWCHVTRAHNKAACLAQCGRGWGRPGEAEWHITFPRLLKIKIQRSIFLQKYWAQSSWMKISFSRPRWSLCVTCSDNQSPAPTQGGPAVGPEPDRTVFVWVEAASSGH